MQYDLKHQSSGPPLVGYRFIWIFRDVIPGKYLEGNLLVRVVVIEFYQI